LPMTELTSGDAIYERIKILCTDERMQTQPDSAQSWRFGILFLGLEGGFAFLVLFPLLQKAACGIMLP
jgi:hypothetical protein